MVTLPSMNLAHHQAREAVFSVWTAEASMVVNGPATEKSCL